MRKNFATQDMSMVTTCVMWGSEPTKEHLEHEQDSPKVNMLCTLTDGRVSDPVFFDADIITSISFVDKLENYALPQLNNNLILQLDNVPVRFAHIVHNFEHEFPRLINRKSWTNCVAPSFS
jgi:hypothetical protein